MVLKKQKKCSYTYYTLCYLNDINEIVLNLGKQLHITPYKPDKNIYKKLKFDQEINKFDLSFFKKS
jgi:hypothetical protein